MDAEPVAAVGRLLDETGLAHGGEQTVDGALGPAGLLVQLRQGRGLPAGSQNIENPDRFCDRVYGFSFGFSHGDTSS